MGAAIAAADADDLLAAWLWVTEGWYVSGVYPLLEEHRDRITVKLTEARRRSRHEARSLMKFGPTPKLVKDHCAAAFDTLVAALITEERDANAALRRCGDLWTRMGGHHGGDPVDLFHRDKHSADVTAVEEVAGLARELEKAQSRLDRICAEHRTSMHEVALLQNQYIAHLVASDDVSPEGHYLKSTYASLLAHQEAVERELQEAHQREELKRLDDDWEERLGVDPLMVPSSFHSDTQLLKALRDEAADVREAVCEVKQLWSEAADRFGLAPKIAGYSPGQTGPADVSAVAALSQRLGESRRRLTAAISRHAVQASRDAHLFHRRVAYVNGAASVDMVEVRNMGHRAFEQMTARLMVRDGFRLIRAHGGSGDLGADVIAEGPAGQRIVIQCKHSSRRADVGTPELQRLNGTAVPVHGADVVIMLTNTGFTTPGRQFAQTHGIHAMGYLALQKWATWGDPLGEVLGLSEDGARRE